ncbi:MAG TPA: c-type cytochrome [Nitrospira sp.]
MPEFVAASAPAVNGLDETGDKVNRMRKDSLRKSWMAARAGVAVVLLASGVGSIAAQSLWAAPSPAGKPTLQGNAEVGRSLFNGKGVCYYCHGVDGRIDKMPELTADTAALIARLNPPPADLRNAKALHLKSDKQRAKAVREGHPGTGMFPDTTMTNQELADTLAYLALLRKEGAAAPK